MIESTMPHPGRRSGNAKEGEKKHVSKDVIIKCPHCRKTARLLRRFHRVDCTGPVIEESTGFAGLSWAEIDVDIDSEAGPLTAYVCEECGETIFTNIGAVDDYIREQKDV